MKEQRKSHEVDQTAQGALADSQSQAIQDQLLQRETIYCKPSAHTDSG